MSLHESGPDNCWESVEEEWGFHTDRVDDRCGNYRHFVRDRNSAVPHLCHQGQDERGDNRHQCMSLSRNRQLPDGQQRARRQQLGL